MFSAEDATKATCATKRQRTHPPPTARVPKHPGHGACFVCQNVRGLHRVGSMYVSLGLALGCWLSPEYRWCETCQERKEDLVAEQSDEKEQAQPTEKGRFWKDVPIGEIDPELTAVWAKGLADTVRSFVAPPDETPCGVICDQHGDNAAVKALTGANTYQDLVDLARILYPESTPKVCAASGVVTPHRATQSKMACTVGTVALATAHLRNNTKFGMLAVVFRGSYSITSSRPSEITNEVCGRIVDKLYHQYVRFLSAEELPSHTPTNEYEHGLQTWDWGPLAIAVVDQTYFACDKNSSNLEFASLVRSFHKQNSHLKLTVVTALDGFPMHLNGLWGADDRGNDNAALWDTVRVAIHLRIDVLSHLTSLCCTIVLERGNGRMVFAGAREFPEVGEDQARREARCVLRQRLRQPSGAEQVSRRCRDQNPFEPC